MFQFVQRIIINPFLKRNNINPLGRWSLVTNDRKAYRRSDLANEDHCGPCGTYAMRQKDKNVHKIHINNSSKTKSKV